MDSQEQIQFARDVNCFEFDTPSLQYMEAVT
jgi:hypothetical protein